MEVYLLLEQVASILPSAESAQLRTLISNQSLFHDTPLQQQLKSYLQQQSSQVQLLPVLQCIIDKARDEPKYASIVVAIATHFEFLQQVQAQLSHPFGFRMFIKECFDTDEALVTQNTVMDNITKVKERMEPEQQNILDSILQQHNYQSLDQNSDNKMTVSPSIATLQQFEPGMEILMQQAYDVLHKDPVLCQQLTRILDSGQMSDGPFIDTIINIYQWIISIDASLWDSLAIVLEQMQTLQESTSNQYESYEDFVQKNFLDGDGQEYLDGEIEQARMQHLFDKFSI